MPTSNSEPVSSPFDPEDACLRPARISLLAQSSKPRAMALAERMADWLNAKGVDARIQYYVSGESPAHADATDLLLVLGGDGSLISVARRLQNPMPIMGVNFGRVGFLSEIQPEGWEECFTSMLANGLCRDWRMGLECRVERDGEEIHALWAVNDLVMARGGLARLIRLDICIDEVPLASLRADGIILSTATGSTGYTGSARGPILYPSLSAYALTPICPYMSNFLPLVLPGAMRSSITVREAPAEIYLTVDGQELIPLMTGDVLHFNGREGRVCFARFQDRSAYPAKLRAAGLV